jgi:hypothetical protein
MKRIKNIRRHNQILIGVLVVQIILSVVVFWPRSAATGGGEPLFADFEAGDLVMLAIEDEEGNRTALRKSAEGWVLPDADDYPAQAENIDLLVEKLVGLNTDRLVTRTDASHKRLNVAADDFIRRLDLEMADGTKQTLYLGSSPQYSAIHFRLDGQDETYLGSGVSTWEIDATADAWVDTTYLSVPQENVTQMTLENNNGTFVFSLDAEGNWTMDDLAADETANATNINAVVRQATSLKLTNPLGKEEKAAYGMDAPNAIVTLEAEGRTITLHVGAKDATEEDRYFVKSSESPYYVRVAEFSVKAMVENTRDDFIEQPPTPTAEATTP